MHKSAVKQSHPSSSSLTPCHSPPLCCHSCWCSCELNRPGELIWLGTRNVSGTKLIFNLDQFPDLFCCVAGQNPRAGPVQGQDWGDRVKFIFLTVLLASASLKCLWNCGRLSELFFLTKEKYLHFKHNCKHGFKRTKRRSWAHWWITGSQEQAW